MAFKEFEELYNKVCIFRKSLENGGEFINCTSGKLCVLTKKYNLQSNVVENEIFKINQIFYSIVMVNEKLFEIKHVYH